MLVGYTKSQHLALFAYQFQAIIDGFRLVSNGFNANIQGWPLCRLLPGGVDCLNTAQWDGLVSAQGCCNLAAVGVWIDPQDVSGHHAV